MTIKSKEVKPRIKSIDVNASIYHQYEYKSSYFGLFDDAGDGTPIVVGSKSLVEPTIVNILKQQKPIVIFYYKLHSEGYWEEYKLFRRYSNKQIKIS